MSTMTKAQPGNCSVAIDSGSDENIEDSNEESDEEDCDVLKVSQNPFVEAKDDLSTPANRINTNRLTFGGGSSS